MQKLKKITKNISHSAYWSRNYEIIAQNSWDILVINSNNRMCSISLHEILEKIPLIGLNTKELFQLWDQYHGCKKNKITTKTIFAGWWSKTLHAIRWLCVKHHRIFTAWNIEKLHLFRINEIKRLRLSFYKIVSHNKITVVSWLNLVCFITDWKLYRHPVHCVYLEFG